MKLIIVIIQPSSLIPHPSKTGIGLKIKPSRKLNDPRRAGGCG